MKTAEEIMQEQFAFYTNLVSGEKRAIIKAINEARIEIVKECAEQGKIIQVGNKRTSVPTGSNFNSVMAHIPVYEFDKKSILKLLDQIK